MNKQRAIEVANAYFPSYPSVKTFYITSDEQAFEREVDAENHARSLGKDKDKDKVFEITREDVGEPASVDDTDEVKALKAAIVAAEKEVSKKQGAFERAAAQNKPAKEIELNTAKQALEDAQAALNAVVNKP